MATFTGHNDVVLAASWSLDGKRIASVGFDGAVRVWNASTGTELWKRAFPGTHEVAYSPDGQYVAVGTYVGGGDAGSGLVYILNAASGQTSFISQKYDHGITGLSWSPDSSAIAYSVENGTIQILDIKTNGRNNKVYRLAASDTVGAVAWSPNGKFLAWAVTTPGNPQVQVINISVGHTMYNYHEHSDLINAIAWSPDSQKIATASNDKTVRIWDSASGTTQRVYQEHTGEVVTVSWSKDGAYLASGSTDKTVHVFSATTGITSLVYRGHTGSVFGVVWSPEGKRIASAGADLVVRVWQAIK
ncbi:WD40 repeat domain-containing protein [Ktedonobacter racemifer]|uniref:WD40 repeat domain-containing protein n=1 Tax=Ktedonobacter racemifer TaxID=363277 RepID=UPI002379FAE1|nr:WD40 repeat domain-containing protein [Ktedonobacter racemifer]